MRYILHQLVLFAVVLYISLFFYNIDVYAADDWSKYVQITLSAIKYDSQHKPYVDVTAHNITQDEYKYNVSVNLIDTNNKSTQNKYTVSTNFDKVEAGKSSTKSINNLNPNSSNPTVSNVNLNKIDTHTNTPTASDTQKAVIATNSTHKESNKPSLKKQSRSPSHIQNSASGASTDSDSPLDNDVLDTGTSPNSNKAVSKHSNKAVTVISGLIITTFVTAIIGGGIFILRRYKTRYKGFHKGNKI